MKNKKERKGFFKEFAAFIQRGSVLDLAVGIIIGGAFQKIVSSFVADLIMPLIGAIGGVNISEANVVLREAVMDGETVVKAAVTFNYGNFIQTVIDFLLIAFVVFLFVKAINKLRKGAEKLSETIKEGIEKTFDKDDEEAVEAVEAVEAPIDEPVAVVTEQAVEVAVAAPNAATTNQLLAEILAELKSRKDEQA